MQTYKIPYPKLITAYLRKKYRIAQPKPYLTKVDEENF